MVDYQGFTKISNHTAFAYDKHASDLLKNDHWRVCVPFRYYIGAKGSNRWVDVDKGYLTNGADIPRALWSILPRRGEYDQAVALHDHLCDNPRASTPYGFVPLNRRQVDTIFYEALEVLKVAPWKLLSIRAGLDLNRLITKKSLGNPSATKLHLESDKETLDNFFNGFTLGFVI